MTCLLCGFYYHRIEPKEPVEVAPGVWANAFVCEHCFDEIFGKVEERLKKDVQ